MKKHFDLDHIDIEKLVADKEAFYEFVYTPLLEAIDELRKRWENKELQKKVNIYLDDDVPKPLVHSFKAVLFRQLFTPNYELRHFIKITETAGIKPMFLEYHDDKFTSNNPLKHSLGKMRFYTLTGKKFKARIECRNVIEFNVSDGKKIKEIKTVWSQSLIDFHHELLESVFPNSIQYLFDTSTWFHRGGKNAKKYYTRYIALFLRNAILFENFILQDLELDFVKEIFLPSFIEVWKMTGFKPIIAPLLPLERQNDIFWSCHPIETLHHLDDRLAEGKKYVKEYYETAKDEVQSFLSAKVKDATKVVKKVKKQVGRKMKAAMR